MTFSISRTDLILCNYADDNVPYAFGSNQDEVKENLNQDILKLSEWFYELMLLLPLFRELAFFIELAF